MGKKQNRKENQLFDTKPELTLAMKLAASFAITYYGMLFIYEIITVIFCHYSIDSYYLHGEKVFENWSSDFVILILELILSGLLVFSLIQIFRKKNNGKSIFVLASLLLIIFQLITTGFFPWYKYALEILLLLIIAPIRMKKIKETPKDSEATEQNAGQDELQEESASEPEEVVSSEEQNPNTTA